MDLDRPSVDQPPLSPRRAAGPAASPRGSGRYRCLYSWAGTGHTGWRGDRSGGSLPGARHGRTARTALDAAAAWMARGASGIWLRAGSRLGLACRGAVYILVGTSLSAWRSPRTDGRARRQAAPGPCRRPSLPRGDVFRWCCSSLGLPRTPLLSWWRPCSGLPTPPARWARGGSVRCRRGGSCCTRFSA